MLMKKYGYAIVTACIIFTIFSVLCINISADQTLHWYCKRNAAHLQPRMDENMQIIEQLDGVYVDGLHGDQNPEKVIYLTFDAGYENGNVEKILDVLKAEDIPGAFFILGNLMIQNPELVQRMAKEGHLVCNHTYTHKNITTMSAQQIKSELQRLENAYFELTNTPMAKYFRPPEGTFDQKSLQVIKDCGYKTVFWSFAYADWDNRKQMDPEAAMKKILDNLHNGEIMLLHPTSATNAAILQDLIVKLKDMGYRFGSLDELQVQDQ